MRNISELQGYLIDLDGTLYLGSKIIQGSIEFISALREKQKNFLILSNNSSKSRDTYQKKLELLGINVEHDEIFTSTVAAAHYIKKNFPANVVYPIGTPDFEEELISLGIKIDPDNADIVLLGFDTTLTYEKIRKASNLINNGALFIATHGDILCPTENGFIPDIGTMIALFEKATNKSPLIIGKPYLTMINSALSTLNLEADSVGMIGDRLYTDIKMANNYGLTGILVLSGETKMADLTDKDIYPDYVFTSIKEIISGL